MRNRIKEFMSQKPTPKKKGIFLNDRSIEAVGRAHHHLGVSLHDGPCFRFPRQSLAWQKGWMLNSAYYEGYSAGMDGKTLNDNPYAKNSTAAPTHLGLAEEWRKGYLAGYTALNS